MSKTYALLALPPFVVIVLIFLSICAYDPDETPSSRGAVPSGAHVEGGNYKAGVAYAQARRWDDAIDSLTRAISTNPNMDSAYEIRGYAYFSNGDLAKAISDFTKCIHLNGTNADAYFNRANSYRAMRRFDLAIADLDICLRLNPTNALAFKCRAAAYSADGAHDKEIDDWSQAIRLNPDDAAALAMRGYSHFLASQFDDAATDYYSALRIDPASAFTYNNLAWMRATCPVANQRNGPEAVKTATKACELTRWSVWGYIDTLAAAYAETGDFEQAVKFQKITFRAKSLSEKDRKTLQRHLQLYQQRQPDHDGLKD
jgi:tetratricopeptide (TPR) repeat protein